MKRFPCLLLLLPLWATSACATDAIAGPERTPSQDVVGIEVASALQAVKAGPESVPIMACSRAFPAVTEPLYIIDGVVMSGTDRMNELDPDEIESIEVVKGAQPAPVYGSRAAAGLIIITTTRRS